MDRFNSITFDERSWIIEYDSLKKGYYLCNNSHSHFCFLQDLGITGIEHVCQNTFLIYSKHKSFYTITRIYVLRNMYSIQYENISFKNILSLSNKTILIKNPECPIIYDVKRDLEFDLPFFQNTSFSVLKKDTKNYLHCSKPIISDNKKFKSIDYLQFVLDVETIQPVLPAFSTLRGAFIDLDGLQSIPKLINEEQYYKKIVENQLESLNNNLNNLGKSILLSSFT